MTARPEAWPPLKGYDAAGEGTQVTDGAGNVTRYPFDALGRQTATVNPDGTSGTVTYDPSGSVRAETQPVSDSSGA